MKRFLYVVLVIILFAGCSKLAHLSQLLTLKSYSEEQADLDKYVDTQYKNFDLMIKAFKSKEIYKLKNKDAFLEKFGDPIFSRVDIVNGKQEDILLYRKPKAFFNSDKMYIYFDKNGNLLNIQYVPRKQ